MRFYWLCYKIFGDAWRLWVACRTATSIVTKIFGGRIWLVGSSLSCPWSFRV
jgi:hypothetical protein